MTVALTPPRAAVVPESPLLDVVGRDLEIPTVTGERRRFVQLDYAASAPPLQAVADTVEAFLPWYSSVHRGAGFTSTVSSEALEAARHTRAHVRRRTGGRHRRVHPQHDRRAQPAGRGAPRRLHGRDARPRAPRQPAAVERSRSRAPRDTGDAHRTAGRVRRGTGTVERIPGPGGGHRSEQRHG